MQYKGQHQNPGFRRWVIRKSGGFVVGYLIKPRKKGIFLVFWGASYIDVPLILIFTLYIFYNFRHGGAMVKLLEICINFAKN